MIALVAASTSKAGSRSVQGCSDFVGGYCVHFFDLFLKAISTETMVYYFVSNVTDPPATIYVGKDKFESLSP